MRQRAALRTGSLSARMLMRVVDFAAVRGHDPQALCRSAGLQLTVLREPHARVPYALAERLGERAVELTRDANIGIHLAQDVRDSRHFDIGLLMLMASSTVRVALERMVRYQRYWGDGERSKVISARAGLTVRYLMVGPAGVTRRHNDECMLAEIVLGLNMIASRAVVPRVVRFQHAIPRDTREHQALFCCPLEFSAAHTEITFDDAALETPMQQANEFYAELFRQQVERAIAALPPEQQLLHEVRAIVGTALSDGSCTLVSTARALGVTARTLQRRLGAESTSFDELVEGLRRELALRYLDRNIAVREIAALLGYAETGAFHRAFKRWTGTTPERARAVRMTGASNPP